MGPFRYSNVHPAWALCAPFRFWTARVCCKRISVVLCQLYDKLIPSSGMRVPFRWGNAFPVAPVPSLLLCFCWVQAG